ncbi:argininosuccinate lyase [Eubacteriales bacterium OttesenSCG-928-N14]|nr:argininosuccinate lyase [Eubacteriales bacterium OttesenSCG-928-N14]
MVLWKGRFTAPADERTNDFNSSIAFDARMISEDIMGSVAHAAMLGHQGMISQADSKQIQDGLLAILSDYRSGQLCLDATAEDIHTFIETELTGRIGEAGKRLHTGRSRNDQVALDLKLYLMGEVDAIISQIAGFVHILCDMAKPHLHTIMPGYTHLQRAQPVTFAHHLMAYAQMLYRDIGRLQNAKQRMDASPLGSGALAATTYDINREMTAKQLGFSAITANSMDAVSDRDFVIETACALSIVMVHLSRFAEEIILWCSHEFGFVQLDDAFSTGSSIMPQKKNPDIAELVRGKSGRVFGDLVSLLAMMKGLPLSYNKDMQEDKEAIFDAIDTVKLCLTAFVPMVHTMQVNHQAMYAAAQKGFLNATDCADYLVSKGIPFRDAYQITGQLVNTCIAQQTTLEDLPIAEYQKLSDAFAEDIYAAVDLLHCLNARNIPGGPAPAQVEGQIADMLSALEGMKL